MNITNFITWFIYQFMNIAQRIVNSIDQIKIYNSVSLLDFTITITIISEENKTNYEQYNKIYIPKEYNKENYKYTINNDTITIITNEDCTTSYNSTYCKCYQYNEKYNIITNQNTCNRDPNYTINKNYITSDINYSDRITNYYKNNYIIMYGIIIIALIVTATLKRNSRKI